MKASEVKINKSNISNLKKNCLSQSIRVYGSLHFLVGFDATNQRFYASVYFCHAHVCAHARVCARSISYYCKINEVDLFVTIQLRMRIKLTVLQKWCFFFLLWIEIRVWKSWPCFFLFSFFLFYLFIHFFFSFLFSSNFLRE